MNFDLNLARENAISHLEESKEGIALYDWTNFRHDARAVCEWFLILASASLLVDMRPGFFFTYLSRAAENWRRFFVVGTGHFKKSPGLAFYTPLHAAIVVGDDELVSKLTAALPTTYEQGMGVSSTSFIPAGCNYCCRISHALWTIVS